MQENANSSIPNLLGPEWAGINVDVLDAKGSSESDKWWTDLLFDLMMQMRKIVLVIMNLRRGKATWSWSWS